MQHRSFLLQVGGGGAGPDYGLMSPSLDNGGWHWLGIGLAFPGQPTTAAFAGRPFVAEAPQSELATVETQEPKRDAFTSDEAFRRAYAAWDARCEELFDAQEAGAVFLSEQGCGYASLMVLTGPHRGAIWEDLRPADRQTGRPRDRANRARFRPLVPGVDRTHGLRLYRFHGRGRPAL